MFKKNSDHEGILASFPHTKTAIISLSLIMISLLLSTVIASLDGSVSAEELDSPDFNSNIVLSSSSNTEIDTGDIDPSVITDAQESSTFSANISYVSSTDRIPLDDVNVSWTSDVPEIRTLSMMISYADAAEGGGV